MRVNAIKKGNANFLIASVQQPIAHDKPINTTDKMAIMGVFINID